MQIDEIKGHRMTDKEFQIFQMNEEDKAFQRVVDALNEIGCTSFTLSEEVIKQMVENGRYIKYDSLCN
jgi:transaldolase